MAMNAQISTEEAVASVKRINESVIKIDEDCKKLLTVLEEASDATNLKSVDDVKASFAVVSVNMSKLQENLENVVNATRQYADTVNDIDATDESIYND